MNLESQILNIPIEDILPNRFQPRLNFDESSLKELSSSIKEHGIIQPLVVRRLGEKFEIIAGERRYKAAKMAGLMTVPAIVSEITDNQSAEVAIVENIQRKNLSSIEEAKSFKILLDKGYLTQEELAQKMGLSQSAISNKLRLLSLSENVQNALMENKISERHARSLLQIDDEEKQNEWLDKVINERLTVKELDRRIKEDMPKEDSIIDEIPLVDTDININEIKEKATDILSASENNTKKEENLNLDTDDILPPPQKIPNKFFNFLEDEEANMNVLEEPSLINNKEEEEEIEMLDFLAPSEEKPIEIDYNALEPLFEQLKQNIESKNYQVEILQNKLSDGIKYEITIKKND